MTEATPDLWHMHFFTWSNVLVPQPSLVPPSRLSVLLMSHTISARNNVSSINFRAMYCLGRIMRMWCYSFRTGHYISFAGWWGHILLIPTVNAGGHAMTRKLHHWDHHLLLGKKHPHTEHSQRRQQALSWNWPTAPCSWTDICHKLEQLPLFWL